MMMRNNRRFSQRLKRSHNVHDFTGSNSTERQRYMMGVGYWVFFPSTRTVVGRKNWSLKRVSSSMKCLRPITIPQLESPNVEPMENSFSNVRRKIFPRRRKERFMRKQNGMHLYMIKS